MADCLVLSSVPLLLSVAVAEPSLPLVTNIFQFHQLGHKSERVTCSVNLRGVVAWADDNGKKFVLQDSWGAELVQFSGSTERWQAGREVAVKGLCSVEGVGNNRGIGDLLVVDNDGAHAAQEKMGAVYLDAGLHLIRLDWFVRDNTPALTVYFEGPNLPRQRVPRSALFHCGSPGLVYHAYEGEWWQMPSFSSLPATREGISSDFDLNYKTRDKFAGLDFSGSIEIPRDGNYTFSTVSEDGSKLYVQMTDVVPLGMTAPPLAHSMTIGQYLGATDESQWASLEGLVTFVGNGDTTGLSLELSSGTSQIRVELADSAGASALLLRNSRVRATGICRTAYTLDGRVIPGVLWTPNVGQLQILDVDPELWNSQPIVSIGDLASGGGLVHLRTRVQSIDHGVLVVRDETGHATFQTQLPSTVVTNSLIEILGVYRRNGTNIVLYNTFYRTVQTAPASVEAPPLLTTVEEIKRLKHDQALRGYPVHVRGVITWSAGSAVVIQDTTAGIFVSEVPVADADGLREGEYWDIQGITAAQFSPMILARKVLRLGLGTLPEPLRPTWDQLINGSLDTQYVEVKGIVTAVRSNLVTLLTHGGTIQLDLPEKSPQELTPYEGTLVRVRGCLWAVKDNTTHVFKIGEVEIHDPAIDIDQPAPDNPFAAPLKRVADLLLFDPQAGPLQRVKIFAQVIHKRGGTYYLMDGPAGLQCVPRQAMQLRPGDLVQVVGFPDLAGPSPVLREAVIHKVGHAALPEPAVFSDETLLSDQHDSTLVRVDAQLVKLGADQKDQVLGLQAGGNSFIARVDTNSDFVQSLRVGSQLELTGVYLGRGGNRAEGRDFDSFELLINYASDIRILAEPPWWNLRRFLAIVGILVGVLGVAFVWIALLRRKVDQRTVQLKEEIHERERAEQQRAVEGERSRIARDLHDDLGSSLTEISLLADAGPGWPPSLEKAGLRFRSIADKARALVNALDVIVWLVNPRKDVLPFLAGYLASYTEEYLSASAIACRLKIPLNIPSIPLTAETRHSLFLAVKETLRNVVRHAHASEVVMELAIVSSQLQIIIEDNGQGFESSNPPNGNGLLNLRDRLTAVGGRCEISSRLETGTKVLFAVPLNNN